MTSTATTIRLRVGHWPRAGLLLLVAVAACREPQRFERNVSERQEVQPPETTAVQQEVNLADATALTSRVLVVAGQAPPGSDAVEQALTQALRRRGLQVLDDPQTSQAEYVVAVWCATRASSWGGMPAQQVLLRYTLLDAQGKAALATGVDSASYADPIVQTAMLGALRRGAENLARQIAGAIAKLPPQPPAPLAPADAAPTETPVLSLAALPFRNTTNRPELTGWCGSLASIAAQEFQRSRKYRIVERAQLGEILKEEDIAAVLGANTGAIRAMGRQLGVDRLLVGEVALRPNGELVIAARLVNAQDAEVIQIIHVAGPASRVNDLEQGFRRQLVRPRAVWITQQIDQLRQAPVAWPDAAPGR